ncbi:hypothetical protein BC936DRAFT_139425 [Jimgerdemannia flammicorona]|uniref:Uncharacterized protein n=1 Tax=Jimgerdemannia flammicorona TaxID=994334 RepID=A0A433DHS7_9FUNG|nr:hypothetical protein BC936DRAFT_139425 [Jimgerdemannia flammicorona]
MDVAWHIATCPDPASPLRCCPLTSHSPVHRCPGLARTQVTGLRLLGVARSQVSRPCGFAFLYIISAR